jgi:electron transfer flavoprotein alpha subunit
LRPINPEDVWIFAEQRSGKLPNSTIEILGGGRKISEKLKTGLAAVLLGHDVAHLAKELAAYGADNVYTVDNTLLSFYRSEFYAGIVADLIKKHQPTVLLLSATKIGMDLAPRLAAKVRTGLTADCVRLDVNESHQLLQVVPAFGGNVMATIVCPKHKPQMATVRPGVMKAPERDENRQGKTTSTRVNLKEQDLKVRILDFVSAKPKTLPIEEAGIIVTGGYGVGSTENWKLVENLAEVLGGAVGSTRPPVDEKWALEDQMIGQSGKTVHPKLYIGAGVSGELQHTVGMQDSKVIVAINKNPNAQIFKVADIGVVGDLREILPLLISEIRKITCS